MKTTKQLLSFFMSLLVLVPLYGERVLEMEQVKKQEIRQSMMGYRDTLIFYTFAKERVILQLEIGNQDESFPISGEVHLFPRTTSLEGLERWINNQHSDGLYPEVPSPTDSQSLPERLFRVSSYEKTGTSLSHGPVSRNYNDYVIKFSVMPHTIEGKFQLPAFTGSARVHVKRKE